MFPSMRQGFMRFGSIGLAQSVRLGCMFLLGGGLLSGGAARAQTGFDACVPPNSGEYLLLVVVQAPGSEAKLNQVLPPSVKAPTCDYLGTPVARMGGFRKPEDADAWASYLREVAALPAFIAEPAKAEGNTVVASAPPPTPSRGQPTPRVSVPELKPKPATSAPVTPQPTVPDASNLPKPDLNPQGNVSRYPNATVAVPPLEGSQPVGQATAQTGQPAPPPRPQTGTAVQQTIAYQPRSLGQGYAVLVDYANQPEIADQVSQILDQPVGLVSYGQRPYLIAEFSADSAIAITTLRKLSQQGFSSLLVEGTGVTVLKNRVP